MGVDEIKQEITEYAKEYHKHNLRTKNDIGIAKIIEYECVQFIMTYSMNNGYVSFHKYRVQLF